LSVKLRSIIESDVVEINDIWERYHRDDFSVPNRNNAVIDAVVEDENGKIVAYGQVKVFAEAMFILDKAAPKRAKIEALILLMTEAIRGANISGIEDIYCFIKDPQFASLISKHFAFEIVDEPGELLLRKV